MRNKKFATALMIIVVLCLVELFALISLVGASVPTEPHNANAMWFEPSTVELNASEISVGLRFNVTVWANSSLETKGWQFWLVYAKQHINVTRLGYTAGSKSDFLQNITVVPVTPAFRVHNSTHNRLDYGEAWIMGVYRNPGYGSLCWIEFEVVDLPPEGVLVEIPLDIRWAYESYDPPSTYLFYSDGSKKPLNVYNGLVKFVGEAPPPVTFTLTIIASLGGTTTPTPGQHVYVEGEEASILATPDSGYTFDHWELDETNIGGANPVNVTMNANHTLQAMFSAIPPPTGTRIFVDPSEIIDPEMVPCSTFSVNISVDDVAGLKACIFNLSYDPEVIGWIGMRIFKVQDQFPTPIVMIDDETGYVWMKLNYSTTFTTEDPTPLTLMDFHVEALGSTPLDLQDTQLLDSQGQPMDHNATDGFFMSLIRDVAVTNIQLERNWTYQGWPVNISVTVKNQGNISETFNLQTYYNHTLIGAKAVVDLLPNQETEVTFVWNTTSVPEGNYTIKAEAETVPYEFDVDDNVLTDGVIWVMTQIRDIAVVDVTSEDWAYQGWVTPITVTVENQGNTTETFNVEVRYNDTLLGNTTVDDLPPGNQTTLTFYWNTSTVPACNNYTISAEIPPIPYEFDTTDNYYVAGEVKIKVYGDVDGDGYVGIDDIVSASEAFGSEPGSPRWNPNADLNQDDYIGIDDIVLIASNFGTEC